MLLICPLIANTFCLQAQTTAPPPPNPEPAPTPVPARSVVYKIENPDAIFDYKVNAGIVRRMVDELVINVTGEPSVAAAWSSLVKPTDIVGIKVCTNGAPLFSTRPEVVNAIVAGLEEAGVRSQNIIIWDREERLLKRAGFRPGAGYRVLWSEGNYDPQAVLTSAITGKLIWGDLLFVGKKAPNFKEELGTNSPNDRQITSDNLSSESHISKVLTHLVTKVINVPVLSDHAFCGLSGALYNMTVQNVDNWRRLIQDPVKGDPAIPEMYADPQISGKVVLHVMDGLVGLYAGAPIGNTNYAVQFGTLYASKDPVALDAVALKQIDQWRTACKLDRASKDAKYVQTAFSYQLGNSDLDKIDLRDLR
jgi:uncharacterized protein (DUF362 family)